MPSTAPTNSISRYRMNPDRVGQMLDLMQEFVNAPGSWQSKRDLIKEVAQKRDRDITLHEFIGLFGGDDEDYGEEG